MTTAANPTAGPSWEAARREFLASWGAANSLPASVLLAARSAAVEDTVLAAWREHLAPAANGMALLAVGGFGRRELFPHSDIDLLVLTRQPPGPADRDALSAFLRVLWDAGLRISQSVHPVADCCELHDSNIEFNASLLDQRCLTGDQDTYAALAKALPRFIHGQRNALARHLARMARTRHEAHGGSICQLEPNVKEAPGGLRDLHLIRWLDQLRAAAADFPAAEPGPDYREASEFLFGLRCWLHLAGGRDMNVLTFDLAEEIAERFGLPAADWMRRYYGHAREIFRGALRGIERAEERSSGLLAEFRAWRSRVSNADFYLSRGRAYFRDPHRIEWEPPLVLSLFQFVARHGVALAEETERRLRDALPRLRAFFAASRAFIWPALHDLLSAPHASLALRWMHETRFLGALFPEWEAVDCLVIRDFYHRYTVDEHTFVALDTLEAFEKSDPRFADLAGEIEDIALVRFALLFHDIGKAYPEGHVAASERFATAAMERIQMPAEQRRIVQTLIRLHLELSAAMIARDLDAPETARNLAARIGTVEDLKRLVLVTYCDTSAVNPTAMTAWRLEQLWRAYLAVYNELTRELDSDRIAPAASGNGAEVAAFIEGFPVRYLRVHSEEEVRDHAELARLSQERGVAVRLTHDNGFYRLTLVTRDRPFLLASVAGALAGFGMNILKAEGFANRQGTILDTFVFSDPHRTLELNPSETDRLRLLIERVALGRADVKRLLQNRPKPSPPSHHHRIRPTVSFDNAASKTATLIEIVAEDRPGLLYALASAISSAGANVELVLIDTQAHKAIDVFYVTREARKLTPQEATSLAQALTAACE